MYSRVHIPPCTFQSAYSIYIYIYMCVCVCIKSLKTLRPIIFTDIPDFVKLSLVYVRLRHDTLSNLLIQNSKYHKNEIRY